MRLCSQARFSGNIREHQVDTGLNAASLDNCYLTEKVNRDKSKQRRNFHLLSFAPSCFNFHYGTFFASFRSYFVHWVLIRMEMLS